MQHQRIDQREDNQIVLAAGGTQEVPAVRQVHLHARILVGPVRVVVPAETLDDRVDLDGIDARIGRGPRQRAAHVVAGPRPDDENIVERRLGCVPVQQVGNRVAGERILTADHILVP